MKAHCTRCNSEVLTLDRGLVEWGVDNRLTAWHTEFRCDCEFGNNYVHDELARRCKDGALYRAAQDYFYANHVEHWEFSELHEKFKCYVDEWGSKNVE